MFNPWVLLGVTRAASEEEVRVAYITAMKKAHPDMKRGNADKAAAINEAYALLKNKAARNGFLATVLANNKACEPCKGSGVVYKGKGFTAKHPLACPVCGGLGVVIKQRRKK